MWAELELPGSLFRKWGPHLAVVTSFFPRYIETTKQGKTAVCPRFMSNSLWPRFLWKTAGAAHLLDVLPSLSQCAGWSFWDAPWLKANIFLERLLPWLPARPLVSRESPPPPGEVLGSSCCQRVEACSAFSPWKPPGCWPALPPALAPFRIFRSLFLLGEPGLG